MNPFKGVGAILLVLAAMVTLTCVKSIGQLILLASVTIVGLCMITLTVSGMRRHHDRLAASGRIAMAPEVSVNPRSRPQPAPEPVPASAAMAAPALEPEAVADNAVLWRPYAT